MLHLMLKYYIFKRIYKKITAKSLICIDINVKKITHIIHLLNFYEK
jgi:hypothetical protein